jgi:hypothetical protein
VLHYLERAATHLPLKQVWSNHFRGVIGEDNEEQSRKSLLGMLDEVGHYGLLTAYCSSNGDWW